MIHVLKKALPMEGFARFSGLALKTGLGASLTDAFIVFHADNTTLKIQGIYAFDSDTRQLYVKTAKSIS